MIPLKSEVSCSSVHASLTKSVFGFDGSPADIGVSAAGESIAIASSSATGVEAALAVPFPFFFGGIFALWNWALFVYKFGSRAVFPRDKFQASGAAAISKIASVIESDATKHTTKAWTTVTEIEVKSSRFQIYGVHPNGLETQRGILASYSPS